MSIWVGADLSLFAVTLQVN